MKSRKLLYSVFGFLMLVAFLGISYSSTAPVAAQDATPTPSAAAPAADVVISGVAFRDNTPVGSGIAVVARFGSGTETAATDAAGRYSLTLTAGSLTSGETVTFVVQGIAAPQTYVVTDTGGAVGLDIYFVSAPGDTPAGAVPTSAPAPAAPTAIPTPVLPAPTGLMDAFGSAGVSQPPSVQLRPVEDVIYRNGQGIIEVVMNNPLINQRAMVVDLSISAPANLVISGQDFAGSLAAGEARTPFRVAPGQSRTIIINITSDIAGNYLVHALATYWPEDYPQFNQTQSFQHQFKVDFQSQRPTPNPALDEGAANAAGEAGGGGVGGNVGGVDGSGSGSVSAGGCTVGTAPLGGDAILFSVALLGMVGLIGFRRLS